MAKCRKANGAGEGSTPSAPSSSERETLDALVATLSGLNLDQLRLQWWAGSLPPIFRDGCSCVCSPIGSRPRQSGISIGRYCGVCGEPRDEAFESVDARPFATCGPTTREGVGLKSGALLVREWNSRLERVMVLDDRKVAAWDENALAAYIAA